MAQVAIGVAGGAIGFVLGGPAGAAIGFSLGTALGASQQTIPGARLGEIARQTAKEGDPRTIVWGVVRPIGPNVIASQEPPRIVKTRQSGKGGPKVENETVYRTYALGVCEGPISGYRRIWRNNKLVYDARPGSEWGAENNHVFLSKATLYLGGYDQTPDPDLEAVFGVGEVPAHRGTAYVVIADEDLTDTAGAVPQWLFEVERGYGTMLTSRPYPIIAEEEAEHVGGSAGYPPQYQVIESTEHASGSAVSGEFNAQLPDEYELIEEAEHVSGAAVSGQFEGTVYLDVDMDVEGAEHVSGAAVSGQFNDVLIEYDNWPTESAEHLSGGVEGGTHES